MERLILNIMANPRTSLLLLGLIFYIPFLGGVHLFDWDEINFAAISQEMVLTGDYLQVKLGGHPFWEKPPLFFWLQSIAFNIFGIGEFSARLPNAIAGLITLQVLYVFGSKLQSKEFGFWWAFAYLGSILPNLYFKSGIIDPVFNLLMFLGLMMLYKAGKPNSKSIGYGLLSGVCVGAAVLAKGPVGILLVGLTWLIAQFIIPKLFRNNWKTIIAAIIAGLLTIGSWMAVEIMAHGTWFIEEFIRYQIKLLRTQDAGHGGFFGYHFVVLLLGCFPVSWFIFSAKRKTGVFNAGTNVFHQYMKVLLIVVLVIFSLVQSKIVHYSSLAYFPLSFFGAYAIYQFRLLNRFPMYLRIALSAQALLIAALCIALPILVQQPDKWIHLIADPMAQAQFQNPLSFNWLGYAPAAIMLLTALSIIFTSKKHLTRILFMAFIGTASFITVGLWAFIGKVENLTQSSMIEFCEEYSDKGIVLSHGGKSYAPYFYGKRLKGPRLQENYFPDLHNGKYNQDAYIFSRKHRAKELLGDDRFELIGDENGFVFFKYSKR